MNLFSNSVYQKLEHLFLGGGIFSAFWPYGAGNLQFDINLVWVFKKTFRTYSGMFLYITLGVKVASWMFYNVTKKDNCCC